MDLQLWPSRTEPEVKYVDMGLRSWRWVLSLSRLGVSIEKQLRNANDAASEWWTIDVWLAVGVRRPAKWGSWHGYYDGPHCAFGLGWIYLYWEGGLISRRCKHCEGEDD